MDLGDREAAEADRIPSPIRVAVSRRGPDGNGDIEQGLNKKRFANDFLRHVEAVLFNSCLLMFLCVYVCLLLNLSETFRGVLSFYFVTSHQE